MGPAPATGERIAPVPRTTRRARSGGIAAHRPRDPRDAQHACARGPTLVTRTGSAGVRSESRTPPLVASTIRTVCKTAERAFAERPQRKFRSRSSADRVRRIVAEASQNIRRSASLLASRFGLVARSVVRSLFGTHRSCVELRGTVRCAARSIGRARRRLVRWRGAARPCSLPDPLRVRCRLSQARLPRAPPRAPCRLQRASVLSNAGAHRRR